MTDLEGLESKGTSTVYRQMTDGEPAVRVDDGDAFGEFIHVLSLAVHKLVYFSWLLLDYLFWFAMDVVSFAAMLVSNAVPSRCIVSCVAWSTALLKSRDSHGDLLTWNERRGKARNVGWWCLCLSFLDVLALPFLVIILAFPLRWLPFAREIWKIMKDESIPVKDTLYCLEYRIALVHSAKMVLMDCFSIIFVLFSVVLVPWQSVQTARTLAAIFALNREAYGIGDHLPEYTSYRIYQMSRSESVLHTSFTFAKLALCLDWLVLPLLCGAMMLPHRIIPVLQDIAPLLIDINGERKQRVHSAVIITDEMVVKRKKIRHVVMLHMYGTLLDIISIPCFMIACFCGIHGSSLIRQLRSDHRRPRVRPEVSFNFHMRRTCRSFFYYTVLDICALPFAILATVGLIRSYIFLTGVRAALKKQPKIVGNNTTEKIRFNTDDEHFESDEKFKTYNYSTQARLLAFRHGCLTVLDAVFLPLLVVLFVTRYRWMYVKKKMDGFDWEAKRSTVVHFFLVWLDCASVLLCIPLVLTHYRLPLLKAYFYAQQNPLKFDKSLQRFGLIVQQLFLLGLDAVHFPLQLILLVTIVRCSPILQCFRERAMSFEGSVEIYLTTIEQFVLFCTDCFTLIMVFLLVITGYRWDMCKRMYLSKKTYLWYRASLTMVRMSHILCHFLTLLVDVIFLPFYAVILLSRYRCSQLLQIMDLRYTPEVTLNPETADKNEKGANITDVNVEETTNLNFNGLAKSVFLINKAKLRYAIAIRTAALMLADMLLLPFTIIVFVSHYRWAQRISDGSFKFHASIIKLSLLLVSDFALFSLGGCVFFTIYRADKLYRAVTEKNATLETRREACMLQFLYLVRDVLVFPLLAIPCATLYRLPSLIGDIIASGSNPLTSPPIFDVKHMEIVIPERGCVEFLLTAKAKNAQEHVQPPVWKGIRVLGKPQFWSVVETIYGSIAVSLAKGLQPLPLSMKLICGSFEHSETHFSAAVRVDKTTKRKSAQKHLRKLAIVNKELDIVLQIEGVVGKSTKTNFFDVKIPISMLLIAAETGRVEIDNPELLQPDQESHDLDKYRAGGVGVRDSFWRIVLMTCFNILTDSFYFLLLVLSGISPIRLLWGIYALCEPQRRQNGRRANVILSKAFDVKLAFDVHMPLMYDWVNEVGKNVSPMKHWSGSVIGDNSSSRKRAKAEHSLLSLCDQCKELEQLSNTHDFNGMMNPVIRAYLASIDRMLVLPVIRANLTTIRMKQLSRYQMAILLELFEGERREAEIQITNSFAACQQAYSDVEKDVFNPQKADGENKWGCFRKTAKALHNTCLDSFICAWLDVITLIMCLLCIVTLYRLPNIARRYVVFAQNGGLTAKRCRFILREQLLLFANDLLDLSLFLLYFVFVAATIIRFPQLITEVPKFKSLKEAKYVAQHNLAMAILEAYKLLSLAFVWHTYVVAVRVVFYAILVPAASFATLLHVSCKTCISPVTRFIISGVLWLVCVTGIVIPLQLSDSSLGVERKGVLLYISATIVACILILNMWFRCANENRRVLSKAVWMSPIVRPTISNAFSLFHLFFFPLQLVCTISMSLSKDEGAFSSAVLFFSTDGIKGFRPENSYATPATIGMLGLVIVWLYVVTIPLAIRDEHEREEVQESTFYRNISSWISEFAYLSIIINLLVPAVFWFKDFEVLKRENGDNKVNSSAPDTNCTVGIDCQPQPISVKSNINVVTIVIISLVYFLFTNLAEVTRNRNVNTDHRSELKDSGHDVKYTELFGTVEKTVATLIVFMVIFMKGTMYEEFSQYSSIVLLAVLVLWGAMYQQFFKAKYVSVPWIPAVRVGAYSLALVACVLLKAVGEDGELFPWAMLVVSITIMPIASFVALKLKKAGSDERKQFLEQTELHELFNKLFRLETKLLLEDSVDAEWSVERKEWRVRLAYRDVPVLLARDLITLESKILCENYISEDSNEMSPFVLFDQREIFIMKLRRADCSFETISDFVHYLHTNLTSPPYTAILKRIISDKFGAHSLVAYGGYVMWSILSFLFGEEDVAEVNRSLFYDYLRSTNVAKYRELATSESRHRPLLCPNMPNMYKFETGQKNYGSI